MPKVATQIYHLSGKLQALQTPWVMPCVVFTRDILLGLRFFQQQCTDSKVTAALTSMTCKGKKK